MVPSVQGDARNNQGLQPEGVHTQPEGMHARLQCVLWAAGGRYQQTHLIHMFLCTGRLPRDYGLESGLCNIAMINNHTREVSGLKAPPLTKRPPQFTAGRFSLPFFAFFAIFHELRHEIVGPVKITF